MSASSKRAIRALLSIAIAWACGAPAHAALFIRNYEIDLADLTYTLQSDGITTAAYVQLPVDPFVFGAVGDQLITTVTFVGNQRVQLWSGTTETVQIQYFGPIGTTQGSKSLEVTRLLGVTGNYDGLPVYSHDQQFTCGNCLIAFTLGDNLTDSQFMFRGFQAETTITELSPGGPYKAFQFTAFADEVVALPRSIPEPAMLGLLAIALAGVGFARRRKLH